MRRSASWPGWADRAWDRRTPARRRKHILAPTSRGSSVPAGATSIPASADPLHALRDIGRSEQVVEQRLMTRIVAGDAAHRAQMGHIDQIQRIVLRELPTALGIVSLQTGEQSTGWLVRQRRGHVLGGLSKPLGNRCWLHGVQDRRNQYGAQDLIGDCASWVGSISRGDHRSLHQTRRRIADVDDIPPGPTGSWHRDLWPGPPS